MFITIALAIANIDAIADDREAELIDAWSETNSFTGKVTLIQRATGDGATGFTATGTATYLKQNGNLLNRQMLQINTNDERPAYAVTNILDGEFQWHQRPGATGMDIIKMTTATEPADFLAQADWQSHFVTLRKVTNIEWLEDKTIDDHDTLVLEITPTNTETPRTTRSYFSKQSGIPIKAIQTDETGRTLYEWSFKIETINAQVDPEIFTLQIPANATLHDMTGPQR